MVRTATDVVRPRRWVKVALFVAGVAAFPALAMVTGIVFAIAVASGSEGSQVGPFLLWIGLTLTPVLVLLWRPGRARLVGLGMLSCAVVTVGVTAAVTLHQSTSAPARAEQRLKIIASHSSIPIYFAGRHFEGHDLDEPTIFTQNAESANETDKSFDVGDRLDVGYGSTCGFLTSGTCGDLIDIEMMRGSSTLVEGCTKRVRGPRGAILVRERFGDWVTYIGDVEMRVEQTSERQMADLVTALRVVGPQSSRLSGDLPPPSPAYRHLIEDQCD